jgi:peptidoglycan/LPS O-acetylase OafA/YrhL
VQMLQSTPLQDLLVLFLIGQNPFVIPLWFLYALTIVSLVFFLVMYFIDIRWLFVSLILLIPGTIFYTQNIYIHDLLLLSTAFVTGLITGYYLPMISIGDNPIAYFGTYSFHIYLLHGPFILPVLSILVQSLPAITRTPVLVLSTIVVSIGVYQVLRRCNINKVFE